jgi:hypothetical protein
MHSQAYFLGLTEVQAGGSGIHCFVLTNVAVAVRVKVGVPPMPVTVKGYVPLCVEELTVTFSVEELPEAGLGVKLPVAPEGRPLMDKVTGELNPPARVIVIV